MGNPLWVASVLFIAVILIGYSPSTFTLSSPQRPQAYHTSAVASEPLTPADRKEIEELSRQFAQKYYTYNVENYTEVNNALLPLLTSEYQDAFKQITTDGFIAAQAVKAESQVESVQISEVDKLSTNQVNVQLTFQAQTTANNQTTKNRYNTQLDLRKNEGHWKINAILFEQPAEFLNIQTLL